MAFLRRLLGGPRSQDGMPSLADEGGTPPENARPAEGDPDADDEATRDREVLRADSERLSDDLLQRQLRYADRSWVPAPQGGPRRADDGDGTAD